MRAAELPATGFYTPSQLVQGARRHDIEVRAADVSLSDEDSSRERRTGQPDQAQPAVRLGLRQVAGLGAEAAARIVAARDNMPFENPQDLALRAALDQRDMQQLAAADALTSLEDETGSVQVIVWPDVYAANRSLILAARLLARSFEDLSPWLGRLLMESRDFR